MEKFSLYDFFGQKHGKLYPYLARILAEKDGASFKRYYSIFKKGWDYRGNKALKRWVDSGYTDFSIYQEPEYKMDLLACYYLMTKGTTTGAMRYFNENIKGQKTILDYSGGLGLSTILLALNNLDKTIYYCDIPEQIKSFKYLLTFGKIELKNIVILNKIKKGMEFDIVYCIEMIEHFKEPWAKFAKDIEPLIKNYLVFAATFNGVGMGHYPSYEMPDPKTGMYRETTSVGLFYNNLDQDFKMIQRFFNNKPRIYKRR